MLQRNIFAVIWWDANERHLEGDVDHGSTQDSHLKLDNGIWDQVSVTFPHHNILLTTYGPYFQYAPEMECMSNKGKRAFFIVATNNPFYCTVPPSVILPNVITGVLSAGLGDMIGFIFPYYDEVITNSLLIGNGNPDEEDTNIMTLGAREELLRLTEGKYTNLFQQALDATNELGKLGLEVRERDQIETHILFGYKEGKMQLMLNPTNLSFDIDREFDDTTILYNAYDTVINKINNKSATDLSIDYSESKSNQVLSYDVPKWKAKSKEEEEKVRKLLNVILKFIDDKTINPDVKQAVIANFYQVLDKLMLLICFGHGIELYDLLKTDQPYLENINETAWNLGVKYYKQIPYDRAAWLTRVQVYGGDKLDDKYLTDPNAYLNGYKNHRDLTGKTFHPTNPPEDPFYTLQEIYKIEPESEYIDFNHKNDEYDLKIEPILHPIVRVNGITFKSADLIIFYNTQFYDLVSFISHNTTDIEIPYISLKDLKLMRDLLEGRIMVQTFRDSLSPTGVVFLGGDRTFYQLSQSTLPLLSLNSVFSFGKRFIEQLQNEGGDMYLIEQDVPRWEEFLIIVSK